MVQRVSTEQVVQELADRGFKLLSEYTQSKKPITIQCPDGHIFETTRGSFLKNGKKPGYNGCYICSRRKHGQDRKSAIEDIREMLESRGFKLIGEYKNLTTNTEIECPKGHRSFVRMANFRHSKIGCGFCCSTKLLTGDEAASRFAERGFKMLGVYKKRSVPVLVECPTGHQVEIRLDSFENAKVGCPVCTGRQITEEQRKSSKFRIAVGALLRETLKKQQAGKPFKVTPFVAAIAEALVEKYGYPPKGYHIDHIIPGSFFNQNNPEEVKACWDIENLRYLPGKENIARLNRLTHEEVQGFSERQIQLLRVATFKPSEFDGY